MQEKNESRNSTLLAHLTKLVLNNLEVKEAEEMLRRYKKLEKSIIDILANRTRNSKFKKLDGQCCYNSEQALKAGLIDEIFGVKQ